MFIKNSFSRVFSIFLVGIFLLAMVGPVHAAPVSSFTGKIQQVHGSDSTETLTPTEMPVVTETPAPPEIPLATETSIPTDSPETTITPIPTAIPTSMPAELQAAADANDLNALAVTLYVKASGGSDANDCLSVALACSTINGAIGKAVSGDTIKVTTENYTGTGTEVVLINKSVILSGGWDTSFTTQSGTTTIDGQNARRVVVVGDGLTVVIERFVVQNGFSSSFGGGIYNSTGSLILNNSTIISNFTASGYSGAGIFNNTGSVTLNNGIVSNNNAGSGGGGGGGGIHNGGTLVVNDSTINENKASIGGGIRNCGIATITYSAIKDNAGGGIDQCSGTLTLNHSSVIRNTSSSNGGGISISAGTMNLNNSTIAGNMATNGGGIYASNGSLNINSSTIAGNMAGAAGGGIDGTGSAISLQNSILSENVAGNGSDCFGTIGSLGYNIISSIAACTFGSTTGDLTNVDPKLGKLIGNPSYYPLLLGSPAINTGNPAGCSGSSGVLSTDQRSVARVGRCDIGAYEYTIPGLPVKAEGLNGTPQRTPPLSSFASPLQVVVVDSIGSPVSNIMVTFVAPASGASGKFSDSGTASTTANTDKSGIATAATFTANATGGSYTVLATAAGIATSANFSLTNLGWYVSTTGNNANNCESTATPCATINGVLEKSGFTPNDTVLVAGGTYANTGVDGVLLNRSVRLLGGWNSTFTTQNGISIIDGQAAFRGITINNGATAIIEHITVQNGSAIGGGGISNSGMLTLNSSIVSNNKTTNNTQGGGIYNTGILTVNISTIKNNIGDYHGGGIYNSGNLVLNNSTVSNNSISYYTGEGGGINNAGTMTLNNITISGNTAAGGRGGGIANYGTATINNNTITGNNTAQGGGISNIYGLDLTLRNSIMAGNIAITGPDCYDDSSIISAGYNLIGNNSNCPLSTSTGDQVGTGSNPINPYLGSLQSNGGPTFTHALQLQSQAVDTGNPATPGSGGNSCFATDQRGTARPAGSACDIGAYESPFLKFFILGNAGIAGAILSYVDETPKTAVADGSGNYSFAVRSGWSGTVTPSKTGYIFTPFNKTYSNVTANKAAQNYTARTNVLLDPSFEAYTPNPNWSESSTNFGTPLCTIADCGNGGGTAGPRTGSSWGWFGGVPTNETASLSQFIVFPNGHARLQFYFWIGAAAAGSDAADIFTAKIDDVIVFSADATQKSSYPTYTLITIDASAFADGAFHTVAFSSVTTDQNVTFNLDDATLSIYYAISGNAGVAGATLGYVDDTPKTAIANGSGLYSFEVPSGWFGTVTPSKTGYNFTPVSKTYTNVIADQNSQNYSAVFDTIPPIVSSITRGHNNPTIAASVNFLVTFSESVTGVEANDFTLTTTGVTGAFISGISGSGATRTVTVKTGSGDGTVRLNLVDDNTVVDWVSNPLGGAGAGNGNFSSGEVYTVDKPDLPAPVLRSPRTEAVTNDTTPTFWWTSVTGGQTYEIMFATDSIFTSNVNSQIVAGSSYTAAPAFGNGKYYWRVRARNVSNQPGAWSSFRSFTIDTTGPSAPVLDAPATTSSTNRTPTFRWLVVPTAVSYEIQYDEDSNFSSPLGTLTVRTNFRKPPAMPKATYYWRVRAKDAAGNWSVWSTPFTINITGP